MTREEAAEKLKSLWYFLVNNDYPQKDLDALKVAIKTLEQEPEWIPVSERVPEKTGIYLISIGDLVMSKSFDGHNFRTESAVSFIPDAWMPLPEPYKAESEDRE